MQTMRDYLGMARAHIYRTVTLAWFAVGLLLSPGGVSATDYPVTNTSEFQSGLNRAQAGDTISLSNGFTMTGNISGSSSQRFGIEGNGYTIDGDGRFSIYMFARPFGWVNNVTITNTRTGDGAPALFVGSFEAPTAGGDAISNSTFSSNYATLYGGAVGAATGSTTGYIEGNVRNNQFLDNYTQNYAGAIGVGVGGVRGSFIGNTFRGNEAQAHAGVLNINNAGGTAGAMTGNFEGNTFQENSAGTYAGALNLTGGITGDFIDNVFDRNTATTFGSAIVIGVQGSVVRDLTGSIRGGSFLGNQAGTFAGAVYVTGGITGDIDGTTFDGNIVNNGRGGALHLTGDLGGKIAAVTGQNNRATGNGGAFFIGGSVGGDVTGGAFTANTSSGGNGGAMYVTGGITGGITGTAFNGNVATTGLGGALYLTDSLGDGIASVTAQNNQAAGNGGAFFIGGSVGGDVTGGVFSGNASSGGSGGAIHVAGAINGGVDNATFDNNSAGNGAGGALYVNGILNGSINAVIARTNEATGDGGAFFIGGSVAGDITGGSFTGNISSGGNGGAIHVADSITGGIEGATFDGNIATAGLGGGLYLTNSLGGGIANVTALNNQAAGDGGALFIGGDTGAGIQGGAFTGNAASGGSGGAVHVAGEISGGIDNVIFTGNSAGGGSGGAIYVNGTLGGKINAVAAQDNEATGDGGAIFVGGNLADGISGGSFTGNTAGGSGGAIHVAGGAAGGIASVILDGNAANAGEGGAISLATGLTGNIADVSAQNNRGLGGGAIYVGGTVDGGISGGSFTTNTSSGNGGAIQIVGDLTGGIDGTVFDGNIASAGQGGALFLTGGIGQGISGVTAKNNAASGGGGALFIAGPVPGGIAGSNFDNNSTGGGNGGAVQIAGGLSGGVTRTSFINNRAAGDGGALHVNGDMAGDVNDVSFGNNSATRGAGLSVTGDMTGNLIKATFERNTATGSDGGALSVGGTMHGSVADSLFSYNTTETGLGGGLYLPGGLSSGIHQSSFIGNAAQTGGGGLYTAGQLAVSGTLFEINTTSGGNGGGILSETGGDLFLENVNMYGNSAAGGLGGGIYKDGGSLVITVTDNATAGFRDNTDSLGANAIHLADANLGVNVGAGGLFDMQDPLRINASGTVSVDKTGDGVWRLAGETSSAGTVAMRVDAGVLELAVQNVQSSRARQGDIMLQNTASTFTLASGAVLRAGGGAANSEHLVQTGGALTLEAGSRIEKADGDIDGNSGIELRGGPLGQTVMAGLGGITLHADSGTLTVKADFVDNGNAIGIEKTGQGRVLLASGGSAYSGDTAVLEGTLAMNRTGALGSSNVNIADGTTFELAADSGDFSYGGIIFGDGTVRKTGGDEADLTGGSLHSGDTLVDGGTLRLSVADALVNSGSIRVNAGILAASQSQAFHDLQARAGTTVDIAGDLTLDSGRIEGTLQNVQNLTKNSTGALELCTPVQIAGNLNVAAGALGLYAGDPSGTAMTVNSGSVTFAPEAVLNIDGYAGAAGAASRFTLIASNSVINGGVKPVYTIGGAGPGTTDYLTSDLQFDDADTDLVLDVGLTWYNTQQSPAGSGPYTVAHGNFTLADGALFTLGTDLHDRAGQDFASGWDGTSLTKLGNGELILASATSDYTGTTTIAAGTLTLTHTNASGLNASDRQVVNNGILRFNLDNSQNWDYQKTISGSGDLLVDGAADAVLALSGVNSYTGATEVQRGRLILTNVDAAGRNNADSAIVVAEGAQLDLNFDGTLNKTVSGGGEMDKTGPGSVILTADNGGFTGSTRVLAGALTATNPKAVGGGHIHIEAGSALNLEFDGEFANRVSNMIVSRDLATDAALNTRGDITLTGDHTFYRGQVSAMSGMLTIGRDDQIFSSGADFDIYGGVTLAGTGIIGKDAGTVGLRVRSGGVVSPGHSIGYLVINGDLVMDAGSVYEVEADPTENQISDRITVTGSARMAGATVRYVGGPNVGARELVIANKWLILRVGQDIAAADRFAGVESVSRFLKPDLLYEGTNVYLVLTREVDENGDPLVFADFAETPNQRSTAAAIDSLPEGSPLYNALFMIGENEDLPAILDQLSGEMHASLVGGLFQLDRDFGRFVLNRAGQKSLARTIMTATGPDVAPGAALASLDPRRRLSTFANNIWANAGYARQQVDDDGNAGRYTLKGTELSLGYDHASACGWLGGAAFRYANRDMKVDSRLSSADIDSYSAAVYGGFQTVLGPGAVRVLAGGAFSRHNIDGTRHAFFGGNGYRMESYYHVNSYQAFLEGAYAIPAGPLFVEPFADLAWTSLRMPGFSEKGAIPALRAHSDRQNNVSHLLGLRLVLPTICRFTVEAQAGWRHTYGKRDAGRAFTFIEGGNRFGIRGSTINRDEALFELRADYRIRENLRVGLEGTAAVGDKGKYLRGGAFAALEW